MKGTKRKSCDQSEALFKSIGKLTVRWNDLDLHLRSLAQSLTDDWFAVAVFSVDLQTTNLIQSIRILTTEYDVESTKLNHLLEAARPKTGHRVRSRDMIYQHVNCVLTRADRLRLYRNLYIHCINSPFGHHPTFTLGGMTTRSTGRLSDYEFPLRITEIKKVTAAIGRTVRYAEKVERYIQVNQDYKRHAAPPWPKKITSYAKLTRPFNALTDRMPLF
jgi:hypothetical protein